MMMLMVTLVCLLAGCAEVRVDQPVARDGVLDLSEWDFETGGSVDLKGEWLFVWQEFVEPGPVDVFRGIHAGRADVPEIWKSHPHPDLPESNLPTVGYGTYVLDVVLPPEVDTGDLAFKVESVISAGRWRFYEANGLNELGRVNQGEPGRSVETDVPIWISVSTTLAHSDDSRLVIWCHLSNYLHARGGMWAAPEIGLRTTIEQRSWAKETMKASTLGILIIVCIYHFVLYYQRREDDASLYFAIFCAAMALRHWSTEHFSQALLSQWEAADFRMQMLMEYATIPVAVMSVGFFIYSILPSKPLLRMLQVWFAGLGTVLLVLPFVTEPFWYTDNRYLYHIYIAGTLLTIFGYLIQQTWRGQQFAGAILFAFGILAAGAINDILYGLLLVHTLYMSAYTFIAFVLIQSGILSAKSAWAFRQVEHLSENLQAEVAAQTQELQAKTRMAVAATQRATALQEEAEAQAGQLQALDRQKTAFFQNMSHELRTPLTLILNPLESLSSTLPDNRDAHIATKNARRLLRLVNQLLDFQKLKAGKQELRLCPIDINRFAYVCGDYFDSACSTKGVDFFVTRDGERLEPHASPVWMMGEIDSLEKVVFNYLSNALKYTPEDDEIELGLTTSQDTIRIFVRDTGMGISEEGQRKLFEVFSQVDQTTTRDFEGT
ncbi:MAG: sensor histidine kinase, partial [Myxococcota bacterium]|nr:sensor histidine kinase [Myxococcota bacterium]